MSSRSGDVARHVAIVGGGFSGAIFARHLLRVSPVPVSIDIVEPRPILGAGVAYSHAGPHQTTNIPSSRMTVDPDDPSHFERWLAGRAVEVGPGDVEPYPVRASFGAYMSDLLHKTVPAHPQSRLRHLRTHATTVTRDSGRMSVGLTDHETLDADAVVLATGNPTPAAPPAIARLGDDPRVVLDPWRSEAFARVRPDDRVLIVGTGLTMGEVVAGLTAAGHRGPVVAISRRGRRPERGMVAAPRLFGDFADHRPKTAIALLRYFRAAVRRAEGLGLSWRSVAAAVRIHGWTVWGSLPPAERRRFTRHLRPYWEALRHVMPGPVHDMLVEEEHRGRLRVFAASIKVVTPGVEGIDVTFGRRGEPAEKRWHERFDLVVSCTGPAYATLTRDDPFWSVLANDGMVVSDVVGLGIAVDRCGRAVSGTGTIQPDLLVVGTLARGTFGELTGVPELSRQAYDAAMALVDAWRDDAPDEGTPSLLMENV